jgi:hypothetical protein
MPTHLGGFLFDGLNSGEMGDVEEASMQSGRFFVNNAKGFRHRPARYDGGGLPGSLVGVQGAK